VEHSDTMRAMSNLADIYRYLGNYMEEESLLIQILDARNRNLAEDQPATDEDTENSGMQS
jgi:hypothetical protein